MLESVMSFITNDCYSVLISIVAVSSVVYCMYSKIKYSCLMKASKMVAEAEGREDLTGEEKFALVTIWIEDELPKIFKSNMVKEIIGVLIEYAYNNSFQYMKNYIKRKTGKDVDEVVSVVKDEIEKQKANIEDEK